MLLLVETSSLIYVDLFQLSIEMKIMKNIANYINALFVVGVLVNLIKVGDILLRPHQQRWMQNKLEELTLWLDYTKPLKWFDKHVTPRVLNIVLIICGSFTVIISIIVKLVRNDLFFGVGFAWYLFFVCATVFIIVKWLKPIIISWLFVGARHLSFVKRFILLTVISFAIALLIAFIANYIGCLCENSLLWPLSAIVISIATYVTVIYYLGLILILTVIISIVLEIILKIFRGVAWRIIEYNRGSFAAIVLLITVSLGVIDLYLKTRK
jgi:hypothetical protein